MKNLLLISFFLLIPVLENFAIAQTSREVNDSFLREEVKVRPFRLGIKLGFPNLIGGNVEYVTPLLNKRLAVNVDHSQIEGEWLGLGENEINFSYLEGGLNYYFFKPGKGLYGGLNYGKLRYTENRINPDYRETMDLTHSTFNLKVGAKLGGLFYFRPEVGYAFTSLPKEIEAVTTYNDGRRETEAERLDIPGTEILFKGLIANIGFGFAF